MAHPTFSGHHGVNLSALFSSAPHTVLQNLPTSVIKEGLVTKQGGRIKTWKVRWCVLDENGLRYYKIDQDIKNPSGTLRRYNNLQGRIDIRAIESVEFVTEKSKYKYCFKITTNPRTYVISAPSQEEMESWINAIKLLIKREVPASELGDEVNSEYSSKTPEELEELLRTTEQSMVTEVNELIDNFIKDKQEILEEMMVKEVTQARKTWQQNRDEIKAEIERRA